MAISLSAIAAKARAYPSRAGSFGAALCKLAESVKATTDALSASITALTPSHVVKFAGEVTWTGSGDTLAATVTGVDADDIVVASFHTLGTQGTILQGAVASADTITFALDAANTSNNAVISYVVYRALS